MVALKDLTVPSEGNGKTYETWDGEDAFEAKVWTTVALTMTISTEADEKIFLYEIRMTYSI